MTRKQRMLQNEGIIPRVITERGRKNLTLIDRCIVFKLSVPCSGRNITSGKKFAESIRNWPPQLHCKKGIVGLALRVLLEFYRKFNRVRMAERSEVPVLQWQAPP